MMRRLHWALALGCALAWWLLPASAMAQSLTLGTTTYGRTPEVNRRTDDLVKSISLADCEADGHFTMPVTRLVTGNTLRVLAGGDTCDADDHNDRVKCPLVHEEGANAKDYSVELTFRELILANRIFAAKCTAGSTAAGCTRETACTDLNDGQTQTITLRFSIDDGSSVVIGSAVTWAVSYDLAGPTAPQGVSLGVGEEQLVVKWTASTANDLDAYEFFCEPKPGSSAQGFQPQGPGIGGAAGSAGTGGTSGSAGTAGTSGAGGTTAGTGGAGGTAGSATGGSVTGGAGGTSTAGGAGGTAGSTSTSTCPASVLVAGEIPPSAYRCGSTTSNTATSGTISNLTNFTSYTVGVAAVDVLGNPGPLSTLVCASPEPVDDFFETYRRAGGKGGDGYCSVQQRPAPGLLSVMGLALLGLVMRRRRR